MDQFWNKEELCDYTSALYSKFVLRDQLVGANETVNKHFTPLYSTTTRASFKLFVTDATVTK